MCLQMLVLAYPVSATFTSGLRDDVSASLAASYHLLDDAFVPCTVTLQPVKSVSPSSRRLLSVAGSWVWWCWATSPGPST